MRLLAGLLLSAAVSAFAQPVDPNQPDMTIDAAVREQVIAGAIAALEKSYIFPDVATKVAEDIRKRDADGEYATQTSAKDFANLLTYRLQAASHDRHLRLIYSYDVLPQAGPRPVSEAEHARRDAFLRSINYGFEKSEKLDGNIGYLELRSFAAEGEAMEKAAAEAMNKLADTDALIIDLRRNGGGSPRMIAAVSSYLFDAPVHLNDLYWRERNRTDEFWTAERVAGKRFGQSKPIFVLTSSRTFSGAEEFAYNLQALKRATIVGETTGGGAHPGGLQRVHDHFSLWVPMGRAINPITKTNWEGVGVVPDVAVPEYKALEAAKKLAAAKAHAR